MSVYVVDLEDVKAAAARIAPAAIVTPVRVTSPQRSHPTGPRL